MSAIGDDFCSQLQNERLKTRGFKRLRRTFSREHEGWNERYQVQGSQSNSVDSPWTFYLNCGIEFRGIPRRTPDAGFPRVHASSRCGVFVPSSRPQYELTAESRQELVDEIETVILMCSDYFAARHSILRGLYEDKNWRYSFLADPELPSAR